MSTQHRADLTDLLARLALVLDDRRFEDLRDIYTEDAHGVSPRGEMHGVEEIIEVVRRATPTDELTQHVNGSITVDLDGDRAEVRGHQLVYFFREGAPPHRSAGVEARYTAVRGPRGWRLSATRINPLWQRQHS